MPALADEPRGAGSIRTVTVSADPAIIGLVGAASFMVSYPYACTEQRIARVRTGLALANFGDAIGLVREQEALLHGLDETLKWIEAAIDRRGLVAYWPGGRGYVSLTAWALQMVVAAEAAGHTVPEALSTRLVTSLRRALRSDFPALVPGSEFAERAWALAALTEAGIGDTGYGAELALRAQFFSVENLSQIVRVLAVEEAADADQIGSLADMLWAAIRTRLQNGEERFLGVNEVNDVGGVILPGEVRTIAQLLRTALVLKASDKAKLLKDALVANADATGWGDTNANAAALAALAETLHIGAEGLALNVSPTSSSAGREALLATLGGQGKAVVQRWSTRTAGALRIQHGSAGAGPLSILDQAHYTPKQLGAEVAAVSRGFVIRREWYRVPDSAGGSAPLEHLTGKAGGEYALTPGAVIEERIEFVNPAARYHVAVTVPLAAGMEPLNPSLKGAPPEAAPSPSDDGMATYRDVQDDRVAWFFDFLPKGTYRLHFRTKAVSRGRFVQPPARVELMYDVAVNGRSHGSYVRVATAKP